MNQGLVVLLALGAFIAHANAGIDINRKCIHYKQGVETVLNCTAAFKNETTYYLDDADKGPKDLILSNNNIGIDFISKINFTGLHHLILSHNLITNLKSNLTTWPEITLLDVSFNNLSVFDVGFVLNFRLMKYVYLKNNKISKIIPDARNITSFLEKLDLSHNQLTTLNNSNFKNLKKLVDLRLSFNLIDSIEEKTFSELNVLEYLRLENNRLKVMNFQVQEKLYHLYLNNNSISVLPNDTKLLMLKTLELSYNNFTTIPSSLNASNFPELPSANFTGNPIKNSTFTGIIIVNRLLVKNTTSPNVAKSDNQTTIAPAVIQTTTIKPTIVNPTEKILNNSSSTEKPLNLTTALNQISTTTVSSISTTSTSNKTLTSLSSNSTIATSNATTSKPTGLSNATVTMPPNNTTLNSTAGLSNSTVGALNNSSPITPDKNSTGTSNSTASTSDDTLDLPSDLASVSTYTIIIVVAVIVVVLIIGVICWWRHGVIKRRNRNRRY